MIATASIQLSFEPLDAWAVLATALPKTGSTFPRAKLPFRVARC